MRRALTLGIGVLAFIAGCSAPAPETTSVAGAAAPATLGLPDSENEHVSAAALGETVGLTWTARAGETVEVYAAMSHDGGATFAAPVLVSTDERPVQANGEQPPRIALVPRDGAAPDVVVAWLASGPIGTLLMTARSNDGGATFGASAIVPGSEAAGNRGWHAIAADTTGRVHALWLDHRDSASSSIGHHAHATLVSDEESVARAQLSQLYVGALDGSVPATSLLRGVCYCCKTALVTGPDGTTYAAWRHVYPGSERDIAFTVSRDGGRTFAELVRVSVDGWRLNACPENGPALAVDTSQRVHVVWPTLVSTAGGQMLRLFHAVTSDGRTFTDRTELPATGATFHPQLAALPDGGVVAAWEETADGGRRIKLLRLGSDEPRDLGAGVSPALAVTPTHTVVAWTDRSSGLAQIAVARLGHGS